MKKKTKKLHWYKVSHILDDRVQIERYEVIKVTEKSIAYRAEFRDDREPRVNRHHQWFPTFEEASEFALPLITERIKEHQAIVNKLCKYEKAIVENRFVDVKQNTTVLKNGGKILL